MKKTLLTILMLAVATAPTAARSNPTAPDAPAAPAAPATPATPATPTGCEARAEVNDLRNDATCMFRSNGLAVYFVAVTPFAYRISTSKDRKHWKTAWDVPVTSAPHVGSIRTKVGTYVRVRLYCIRYSTTEQCTPKEDKFYGSETLGGVIAFSYPTPIQDFAWNLANDSYTSSFPLWNELGGKVSANQLLAFIQSKCPPHYVPGVCPSP